MREYLIETTFDLRFTTRAFDDGVPTTLAGSPSLEIYGNNTTTPITTGITLSVDFSGVTGLNSVRVVATVANGYAQGSNYSIVIAAGTVDGVSVVGEVVAEFSIEAQAVGHVGEDGIDRASFAPDTGLQSIRSGTAQAGGATTITLDASANAVDNFYNGTSILTTGGTGAGQFRIITDYVGATKVATVDAAWVVNPDNTTTFAIFPAASTPEDIAAAVMLALATDTFGEPTGVPAATTTLVDKMGRLYMVLRNGLTVTATKKQFLDDGGAAEWEKDLSDNGTTYAESEGNAP